MILLILKQGFFVEGFEFLFSGSFMNVGFPVMTSSKVFLDISYFFKLATYFLSGRLF